MVDFQPPALNRPKVGGEPEGGDDGLRWQHDRLTALNVDLDLGELAFAVLAELRHLGVGDNAHTQLTGLADDRLRRPELRPAVYQRDAGRDGMQREDPVQRRITAADDHDVLPGVAVERRHEVDHPATEPAVAGEQVTRRELADAGGDQHRSGPDDLTAIERDVEPPVGAGQRFGLAAAQVRRRSWWHLD